MTTKGSEADNTSRRRDVVLPLLSLLVTVGLLRLLPHAGDARDVVARVSLLFGAAATAVVFRQRPIRFALGIGVVLVGGMLAFQLDGAVFVARSPYGVSRVVDDVAGHRFVLFHGSTMHGAVGRSKEPQLYYAPNSAVGTFLASPAARAPGRRVDVVGMGAGSLAWYLRAGQHMRFFEIDPVVIDVATRPDWFSFVSASAGSVDVVQGDGRVSLAREADASCDVIVLDAFSSDAIPVHLLTVEALDSYLHKLRPGGVLLFNTSNRHLDITGVVAAAARARGLAVQVSAVSEAAQGTWVAVARQAEDLAQLPSTSGWHAPAVSTLRAWTDDRSSVVAAMVW